MKTTSTQKIVVPLNRVEGDLEIEVQLEDNIVVDAWAEGTMFRGFERLMKGRTPLDSLVLTPRICGICSTSHLLAATRAIEDALKVIPPVGAIAIRNISLAAESLQSDLRHAFLMFCADFTNPAYSNSPLYETAQKRYRPLHGTTAAEVIKETKKLVEIIAILGGQWPHSSFIVPGGLASIPKPSDLRLCRSLLCNFQSWYETRILGCPIERFAEVDSDNELHFWLQEKITHFNSDLGIFLRFCDDEHIAFSGKGTSNFISYGNFPDPKNGENIFPSGLVFSGKAQPFDSAEITEHLFASYFTGSTTGGAPLTGNSEPEPNPGTEKYSWIKAPRYQKKSVETGPLAELLLAGDPLFTDMVATKGVNSMTREMCKITRAVHLLPQMFNWIDEAEKHQRFYHRPPEFTDGTGIGLIQAARGSLGHWVEVKDGVIEKYQVITPTTWNASPRDEAGQPGAIEQALVGVRVKNPENPVELGHIVRSFDPCLTCSVHTMKADRTRIGGIRIL